MFATIIWQNVRLIYYFHVHDRLSAFTEPVLGIIVSGVAIWYSAPPRRPVTRCHMTRHCHQKKTLVESFTNVYNFRYASSRKNLMPSIPSDTHGTIIRADATAVPAAIMMSNNSNAVNIVSADKIMMNEPPTETNTIHATLSVALPLSFGMTPNVAAPFDFDR